MLELVLTVNIPPQPKGAPKKPHVAQLKSMDQSVYDDTDDDASQSSSNNKGTKEADPIQATPAPSFQTATNVKRLSLKRRSDS